MRSSGDTSSIVYCLSKMISAQESTLNGSSTHKTVCRVIGLVVTLHCGFYPSSRWALSGLSPILIPTTSEWVWMRLAEAHLGQ